jgi:DNA-binding response OmpR family regulator
VRDLKSVSDRASNAKVETVEGRKQLSLLLVDDDAELCEMMREFFAEGGHHLECACTGREGLASALRGGFDLVILDVMLPGIDGLTVLEQIRHRKDTPVIMLTARVQQHDRILGLNLGADDYLPKPFDPDELMARVRAVLRRTEATSRQVTIAQKGMTPLTVNAKAIETKNGRTAVLTNGAGGVNVLESIELDNLTLQITGASGSGE